MINTPQQIHERLKLAQEEFERTSKHAAQSADVLKKRVDAVAGIEGDIAAVTGELEKLDALPSVTAKDQLNEENTRRRLRQLDEQLEQARAEAKSAEVDAHFARLGILESDLRAEQTIHRRAEVVRGLRRIAAELLPVAGELASRFPDEFEAAFTQENVFMELGHALKRAQRDPDVCVLIHADATEAKPADPKRSVLGAVGRLFNPLST